MRCNIKRTVHILRLRWRARAVGLWAVVSSLVIPLSGWGADSSTLLFPADVAHRLDSDIRAIAKKMNLPSVVVQVSVPGRGSYAFVGGYANLETHLERVLESPFRIASITKPFAATAVLVLVDRGMLNKSDPIAKWYPQFPNADQITVDDLLRMRSGIPAPNDEQVLARVYDSPLEAAPSLVDELASIARLKSDFKPPNSVGVYTDFNYDILAGIVQRVTGRDIGQVITETVIVPLKLHDTSFPTGIGIPGPLRGYGWNPVTKQFDDKTLFNPPLAGAAGAVISSIADLQKFARGLCKGGLLKPRTQKERMLGQPLVGTDARYGEGVALGFGFCGHSGTINGFSTDMYYVKKLDASLVISVNRLDRDNKSQSLPIFELVSKVLVPSLGGK
jgi:D-alanyl-D-alanine carboxypeptidase